MNIRFKLTNELMKSSTFHGIPKLVNAKNLVHMLLWFSAILLSYSYCLYVIVLFILEYLEYPIVTNLEVVNERAPEFSAITFCNHNKSKIVCKFDNRDCPEETIKDSGFLYCSEFNTGLTENNNKVDILHTKQPGSKYGLKLKLTSMDSKSIYLFVHNRTTKRVLTEKIYVSAATVSNFVVHRVFEHKLSTPVNKCRKKSKRISGNSSLEARPYSQYECFTFCYYSKIAESCNQSKKFSEISDKYFYNTKLFYEFVNHLISECDQSLIELTDRLFAESGPNEVCKDDCPIACDSIHYNLFFFGILTRPKYFQKDLKTGLAYINIYYKNFEYMRITQVAKITYGHLLGNIGGILSLFLGISVLSLVEIIDLLSWIVHFLAEKRSKKVPNKKDNKFNDKKHIKNKPNS